MELSLQKYSVQEREAGVFLLLLALGAALLFHGGLTAFTYGNTYDAYIHMFFADSYHRSWFDTWEPRWYTGFSTTSYPPGTHMIMAGLQHLMPLEAAFVATLTLGMLILTVGLYRFALIWVPPRAAGYAALGLVLASSIAETLHIFGQLPTIFSLGLFLNALPHVFAWLVRGSRADLLFALIYASATTAAHHVTTLFGMVLFIGPIALHALRVAYVARTSGGLWGRILRLVPTLIRGLILGTLLVMVLVITVFAYWYWSLTDPITQVSIPHGSRENFIARPDLGFVFFILPWGTSLLALPYVFYKSFTSRLWPLGLSILLCFVLGTGGTTPIPKMLLGSAFDILTLDRFTFWGSILMLPVLGFGLDRLINGPLGQAIKSSYGLLIHRGLIAAYYIAVLVVALFTAVLPTIRPTQPAPIDATPIVTFMERDEHDRWRYLTLGFGDQFALIAAKTTALSVDGNYHSARRLPFLTSYAVERLENAKYLGVPGLGSLQQFLINAPTYHLKYVFSNDAFYDPLLHFTGWTRLNRLTSGVTIWEKGDVPPLPTILPRRQLNPTHTLLWSTLPPTALTLAGLLMLWQLGRGQLVAPLLTFVEISAEPQKATGMRRLRYGLILVTILTFLGCCAGAYLAWRISLHVPTAREVVEAYMDDLDFRRFANAHARLDPETRPDFETFLFERLWVGGLVNSFGKLDSVTLEIEDKSARVIDWRVTSTWLTALGAYDQPLFLRTIKRDDGHWYIVAQGLAPQQSQDRVQIQPGAEFALAGRRQPRLDTDIYRDRVDRPRLAMQGARLVKQVGPLGRYAIVGGIYNDDTDPAFLTIEGRLRGARDEILASGSLAQHGAHRLLGGEYIGFRVDVEGVLSLQDAKPTDGFDPDLFVPPILEAAPISADVTARGLAHGADLYRGIALLGLEFEENEKGLQYRGRAYNRGTSLASVTRITCTLFDLTGQPVWVQADFLEANLIPGQEQPFAFTLPLRDFVEVLTQIPLSQMATNGTGVAIEAFGPAFAPKGLIPLDPTSGYSGVHIHVSSMTHDPLD